MSLEVFRAYIDGYSDHLLDQQILSMQSGYWAAYFVGSKHPKSMKELAEKMCARKDAKRPEVSVARPEVDVESFLEREANFKARLEHKE